MYPRLCLTGRLCCAWKGRIKPLWRCLRKRKYSGSRPHQSRRMKPLWRRLRKLKAPEGIGLGSGCFRKMRIRENVDFAGDDFRKE